MTTGLLSPLSFFRGQTLQFNTTFYDFNGAIVQPGSASLIVWYESETAPDQELIIPMQGPVLPAVTWTALLDTRNFQAPRQVQWSIHSNALSPSPVAVQDGTFMLAANMANQPNF
jgi:hypothetical protein